MSLSDHVAARKRLPNRRPSETVTFEHAGADFTMTTGRYADGTSVKYSSMRHTQTAHLMPSRLTP